MFKVGDIIKPQTGMSIGGFKNEFGVIIQEGDHQSSRPSFYRYWTVHWILTDKIVSYKFYEWQYFDIVKVQT
jgi:hypothetical protein